MSARLFCKTGVLAGSEYPLGGDVRIGRDSANQIVIDRDGIEDEHARIWRDESKGCYFIEKRAAGGLSVDDVDVNDPIALDALHVITFATEYDFIFQVVDRALEAAATPPPPAVTTQVGADPMTLPAATPPIGTDPVPPAPRTQVGGDMVIPSRLPEKEQPVASRSGSGSHERRIVILEVTIPGAAPIEFPLSPGDNVVGRREGNEVVIDDPSLSRRHAVIQVGMDQIAVRDLGSKNGTFVDGRGITADTTVWPGTVIRFGQVVEANLRVS